MLLDLNLFCLFCLPRFLIYNSVFFCSGFTSIRLKKWLTSSVPQVEYFVDERKYE